MKKIYKFLILIMISSVIFYGSGIVSADSTTAYVVGRNIGDMELLVKESSSSPTQAIYVTDLGNELIYLYIQTDADEAFVAGFYGAKVYLNSADNKWYFDRSYPFIQYKEQQAYDTGYNAAIQANYQEIYLKGYNDGRNSGLAEGETIGYNNGYDVGYSSGFNLGYDLGYDNGFISGTASVSGDYAKYQLYAVGNGSTYYNWIDLEAMVFHRSVQQVIFNGSINEAWSFYSNSSGDYAKFSIVVTGVLVTSYETNTASSNYLLQRYILGNINNSGFCYLPSESGTPVQRFYISIAKTSFSGWNDSWTNAQKISALKMYLGFNPLIINYRVAAEEETINQQILDNIGVYKTGYLRGKNSGIAEGKAIGYAEGEEAGYNKALDVVWLKAIFTAFTSFFAIRLFGNITIGIIVGVPLFIMMGFFVFKLIKGGN